jgi:hypothetical protein
MVTNWINFCYHAASKFYLKIWFLDTLLLLVCIASLAVTADPTISSDGAVRFAGLQSLAEGQVPTMKFSLIQAIISLPLYGLANQTGVEPALMVAYLNLILFIALLLFVAYGGWPATPVVKRTTALLLVVASMFPHHIQHYFGEVLSATFVAIGFLSIRTRPRLAFICLGIGVANTPAILPAYVIALGFISYKTRRLHFLAFIFLPVIFFLFENILKYHSLLPSAYLSNSEKGFQTVLPYSGLSGFSYPLHLGVLSIIFSFGKGLLWFVPGLMLFFRRDIRRTLDSCSVEMTACMGFVVGLVLCYAKWWAWYGGVFWGPRFFLFACIPAAMLLASSIALWRSLGAASRVLTLFCLFLSTWGSTQGYLFGQRELNICTQNQYALESMCWYVPEFSPLLRQFVTGFDPFPIARISFAVVSITVLIWLLVREIVGNMTQSDRAK